MIYESQKRALLQPIQKTRAAKYLDGACPCGFDR
jgi:hypothetical protein